MWHFFCYSVGKEEDVGSHNILKGADAHKQEDREMKHQNHFAKDLPRGLPNTIRLVGRYVLTEDVSQKLVEYLH